MAVIGATLLHESSWVTPFAVTHTQWRYLLDN
jgi:hypothetical protein